ncbi:hypothetical protein [Streptomyces sp. GbtcB6]|uniref:hypothetical protein n=1 Tax=Streptomyces sp. GbtcB6 TaxID=2824751 RepID=UPI001C30A86B|nr:hypothetical protein [Streptomyces sp. GbtcB6]
MATQLASADIAPVPLTDPGLPTIDFELVRLRDRTAPATALFLSTAGALTDLWSTWC